MRLTAHPADPFGQAVIVLLAHPNDVGAHAVARVLAGRSGPAPLVLAPERLSGFHWAHRVGPDGRADTRLAGDGLVLATSDVACLLNRTEHVTVPRFVRASARDRDYATMELQALVASWLAGLGSRVVNPSTAMMADAGPASPRQWLALAARHGLPTSPTAVATSSRALPAEALGAGAVRPLGPWVPVGTPTTGRVPVEVGPPTAGPGAASQVGVLVADGRAVGPLATRFGGACVAVAAEAGCRLVAFRFGVGDGDDEGALAPILREVVSRPALREPWQVAVVADLLADLAGRATAA